MDAIDPTRLDLVEEFHANPFGPHGAELQQLLKILLWDRPADRYITIQPDPGGPSYIARQTGKRGTALRLVSPQPYDDLAEAWCTVFRKRWETKTGHRLTPAADASWTATLAADAVEETCAAPQARRVLLAYADRFSARPGETIEFKVSAKPAGDYEAALVRIRCADGTPLGAGYKETEVPAELSGRYHGRCQQIATGSFVEIPGSASWPLGSFAIQAYVWPTTPGHGEQAIAGAWNEAIGCGYALTLDRNGAPTLLTGDGRRRSATSTATPLRTREWYLLAASFDASTGEATVLQRPLRLYGHGDPLGRAHAAATFDRTGAPSSASPPGTTRPTEVAEACTTARSRRLRWPRGRSARASRRHSWIAQSRSTSARTATHSGTSTGRSPPRASWTCRATGMTARRSTCPRER